jgi:predicted flap endonuclease-1-like 5' DNA nuclease
MTPLIIALVSFATALVAGLLLSKAFFTAQSLKDSVSRDIHHESLSKQRKRYRKQLLTLHNKAQKKITVMRKKIADRDRKIDALESASGSTNSTKEFYDAKHVESLHVEIAVLRENLETRDERIAVLDIEIRENHIKALELQNNLNAWKVRISPLTKKLHEQRELIDRIQASAEPHEINELDDTVALNQANKIDSPVEDRPDDLKKIRGIGPVLERRLNTTGVSRFEQIAEMSTQDLMDLAARISISPAVAQRDNWIQQARSLQNLVDSSIQPSA